MGNRPRIGRVNVREEQESLVARMKEKHPEAKRTEILSVISAVRKKETPSVAGINVSSNVKKALQSLPVPHLSGKEINSLEHSHMGLDEESNEFRLEKEYGGRVDKSQYKHANDHALPRVFRNARS